MEAALQEAARELGTGGRHCRDLGQQYPVMVVHTGPLPFAGCDSLSIHPWLHQPGFLFPGWALLLFVPRPRHISPALGLCLPSSDSLQPLSPSPIDLKKSESISVAVDQIISINSHGSMGPDL